MVTRSVRDVASELGGPKMANWIDPETLDSYPSGLADEHPLKSADKRSSVTLIILHA